MSARGDRLIRKLNWTAVCGRCGKVYFVVKGHKCKASGRHRRG